MATLMSEVTDIQLANNAVTVTTTVYDNAFSISDASQAEGDSGVTSMNFTVSRTNNAVASSVDYQTQMGTAMVGSDYVAVPPTTLNFTVGGSLTQTVTISIIGDSRFELDETFMVILSNPMYGILEDGEGSGTILNDDPAPEVAFDAAIYGARETSGQAVVTVTLSTILTWMPRWTILQWMIPRWRMLTIQQFQAHYSCLPARQSLHSPCRFWMMHCPKGMKR